MSPPLTVVVVNSLSYTGTTWLNLVLGSHPRAFTIGPPDRVYQLLRTNPIERPVNACRVHGPTCQFWEEFCAQYNPSENYFVQLAAHAQCDFLVINNPIPSGAGIELEDPSIVLKPIQLIRDGRAIAASYRRKHPNESFFDGVKNWLAAPLIGFPFDTNDPDLLCLRYEDVLTNQRDSVKRIGQFIGLDYGDDALRFWEAKHHITAGNAGTIMMIKLAQGIGAPTNENRAYYEDQLQKLQADPSTTFDDQRWTQELSSRDLFVFDHFCGRANERFGYERDGFTTDEHRQFDLELHNSMSSPDESDAVAPPTPVTPAPPVVSYEPPESKPPLRAQLVPSYWSKHGLELSALQTRKLAVLVSVCLVISCILIITLAVLLGLFASSS